MQSAKMHILFHKIISIPMRSSICMWHKCCYLANIVSQISNLIHILKTEEKKNLIGAKNVIETQNFSFDNVCKNVQINCYLTRPYYWANVTLLSFFSPTYPPVTVAEAGLIPATLG
jgi:hypothetical protein